jgi:hypothetical protein
MRDTVTTARERESQMLARCADVARGGMDDVRGPEEANVFRVAAMVVQSSYPHESASLRDASDRYFVRHPDDRVVAAEVVRKGWVVSLPRLRDMLSVQLSRLQEVHGS